MPPRFTHGDIKKVLRKLRFVSKFGSNLYKGIGHDRLPHTCKFDYHNDHAQLATGTAQKIAKSLGFKDQQELLDFINRSI